MWKLALAFVVGAAAGWLVAVGAHEPDAVPVPPPATLPNVARPEPVAPQPPRPPRVRAGSPVPSPETAPAAGKPKKTPPPAPPVAPTKTFTDDEIRALMSNAEPGWRSIGLEAAVRRGLVSVAQLLDKARGDPDASVRANALGFAVGMATDDDGTLALVSAEVLAWARDADPARRDLGLEFLDETGAYGASLGRELLDAGALPPHLYESAVRTLVAARRFDRLAPDPLDDESRERLLGVLSAMLDDDASVGPQVVAVLREAGPPASAERVPRYCRAAIQAGAPSLVRDIVKSPSAPTESRAEAIATLFEDKSHAAFAVALTEEVLTDATTPAGVRRRIIVSAGECLLEQGTAGKDVLRRARDHDPNVWVRAAAAECLAGAE